MQTQGIDYTQLSLKDALDLAVLIEEEAKGRYEEFAAQMEQHHTPQAASFFKFMAGNEEKHRAELAARRSKHFPKEPRTVRLEQLFDVEAPEYHQARALMSPRQALQLALESEKKAWAFFNEVTPKVRDAEVKKLFAELMEEEVHHQQLVKQELGKLPADDAFKAEDFEDEPVAQD